MIIDVLHIGKYNLTRCLGDTCLFSILKISISIAYFFCVYFYHCFKIALSLFQPNQMFGPWLGAFLQVSIFAILTKLKNAKFLKPVKGLKANKNKRIIA